MEAAPKLPMLSFDLKVCTEGTQFSSQLKQYIAAFYNEDPDSYITEIHNLETLRAGAVRPSMDLSGVQLLKKYYCQLHFLKSRFPMEENQDAAVQFSWKDPQLDISYSSNDIRFELMVIMYNIGALHSYLGANDTRSSSEGMKLACTHFQCAAWAFQTVKEKYHQFVMYISLIELVHFFQQVCLAQAQECILEKSMLDNRKATIIAKVAVQVYSYYRQSLTMLESCSEDLFRDKMYKEWTKFLQFKLSYYKCVALLFQGQQAEEQQKMGERVAFYQAACEQLEEAKKWANSLKNKHPEVNEGLAFTQDVVEGKRKAAKNENEFIYHEEVPSKDNLQEVKGASLVKGIAFSINDAEISGPDIFARLVPMEAHEAASLYSEKKAQMLRNIGELIESKDQALAEFMSSMQLDMLTKMHQATGVPQDIVDRAAAIAAKPTATQDLVDIMGQLSGIYQEVESNLKEIDNLLKEEEEAEKGYQEIMGKRPPSIIATDLAREAAKYKEAHNKANGSNQTLHRAMMAHVANLKLLQQPLRQLQQQLPAIEFPNPNIDDNCLRELESLASKVEEMRNQRAMLWAQLRESVHKDDITNSLVTKQPNQSLEQLFQQELKKHEHLTTLIEQNTVAQENIKKAIVESYAKAIHTRRYIQDVLQKRNSTISALITSYDSYDDLIAKANKGIEFYTKLETNVSKLLQRIKSACKVQQEEREQVLLKNDPKLEENTTPASTTPKLKDYLDMRKKNANMNAYPDPSLQYQQTMNYAINPSTDLPVGVRPAPLGSEFTDSGTGKELANNYPYNYQPQMYQYQQPGNADQEIINRMSNLLSNSKSEINTSHYPQYSSYTPQNYTPTSYPYSSQPFSTQNETVASSYDHTKAYTTTTNTYKVLSSSAPNNTNTHMQYPDTSLGQTTPNKYQYPPSATQPAHNVNTYYPTGYDPNYSTANQENGQNLSGNVQYHSLEYATSVQPNIMNISYNSTYSSPISNMTSAPARDHIGAGMDYNVYASDAGTYPTTSMSYSAQSQSYPSPTSAVVTSTACSMSYPSSETYSYPYSNSNNVYQYGNYQVSSAQSPAYGTSYSTSNTPMEHASYPSSSSTPAPQQGVQYGATGGYDSRPTDVNPNVSGTHISQQTAQYGTTGSYDNRTTLQQADGGVGNSVQQQNMQYGSTNNSYDTGNPDQSVYGYQTGGTGANLDYASYAAYYQQYGYNYAPVDAVQQPIQQQQPPVAAPTPVTTKESNVDLLSGLDFTISQAPLLPQQTVETAKPQDEKKSTETKVLPKQSSSVKDESTPAPEIKHSTIKILPSKPLNNNDVKNLFNQEIDKYEKYVETLTNKTLSGPTNLDVKWKEIQDKQDGDGQKKIISVARCYPMKNRFPDILPYDHSRIMLTETKDDYINASLIKDVSLYSPAFIVTQTPLSSTVGDFWTMIREQQVELVFCLLSDGEIGDDAYWPREKDQQLNFLNMVITLKSVITKSHWVERLICVNVPEKRESWVVMHLQFTSWPGSLFPTSPDPFVSYVIELISLYQQQRSSTHPIVVHCSSGIGRSGLICLLTAAIYDVTNNANSVPDLALIASKLTNYKKNILRDREHLKFAYECFLAYMRLVVNQDKMKKKMNEVVTEVKQPEVESQHEEVVEKNVDPLSTLDPFWASKK